MAAMDKLGKQFFNKNVGFNLFDEQFNDFSSTTLAPPNTGMFDAALAAILPPGVRRNSSDLVSPLQNGTPLLYQGAKFSSFEALSAAVDQYSRQNGVKLFRSDSRTLRSAPNRANPIIPQLAPVELVYYSLTYSCVFAGKSFKNFGFVIFLEYFFGKFLDFSLQIFSSSFPVSDNLRMNQTFFIVVGLHVGLQATTQFIFVKTILIFSVYKFLHG